MWETNVTQRYWHQNDTGMWSFGGGDPVLVGSPRHCPLLLAVQDGVPPSRLRDRGKLRPPPPSAASVGFNGGKEVLFVSAFSPASSVRPAVNQLSFSPPNFSNVTIRLSNDPAGSLAELCASLKCWPEFRKVGPNRLTLNLAHIIVCFGWISEVTTTRPPGKLRRSSWITRRSFVFVPVIMLNSRAH